MAPLVSVGGGSSGFDVHGFLHTSLEPSTLSFNHLGVFLVKMVTMELPCDGLLVKDPCHVPLVSYLSVLSI